MQAETAEHSAGYWGWYGYASLDMIDEETLLTHRGFVAAVARQLLADENDVDDVVQETCLAAMRAPDLRSDSLKSWFAVVARNFARKVLRARRRRARRDARAARQRHEDSAVDAVGRLEWHRTIVSAVLDLPEPYRSTVLARYYEGTPPGQIAQHAGIPAATVRTRLHRAHQMLRRRLDSDKDGSRAWLTILAAYREPGLKTAVPWAGSVSAAVTVGAILMTKIKIGIALAALLAALLVWQLASRPLDQLLDPGPRRAGHEDQTSTPPDQGPSDDIGVTVTHSVESVLTESPEPARCTLSVTARDDQGSPLSGGLIAVMRVIGLSRLEETAPSVELDSRGCARIEGLTPGQYRIMATPPPSRPTLSYEVQEVKLKPSEDVGVEIVCREGVTLHGRVVDCETGDPLGSVRVTCVQQVRKISVSDVAGRFHLSGLWASTRGRSGCAMLIEAEGYAPSLEHVSLPAEHPPQLSMRRAVTATVRVVDEQGDPLPGAEVFLYRERITCDWSIDRSLSGDGGVCTLSKIDPGPQSIYLLIARGPQGRGLGGRRFISSRDIGGGRVIRIAVQTRTRDWQLRVLANGEPCRNERAVLVLRTPNDAISTRRGTALHSARELRFEATTDVLGFARFAAVPHGRYAVEVVGPVVRLWDALIDADHGALTVDMAERPRVKAPESLLRGVLRDANGPVSGARILLFSDRGMIGGALTGRDGTFRIKYRGARAVKVAVELQDDEETAPHFVTLPADLQREVVIRIDR
jgi:RNA polymerase sigma factor (sigma-70 family)